MLRFGVSASTPRPGPAWRDAVRRFDDLGVDIVSIADHVGRVDPFPALAAAAMVSDRLRLGTYVLNVEFWNPLLLARAAATVDLLADGRLELGIGAGHAQVEFEQAGIPYHPPRRRIDRLEQVVPVLRRLLDGDTVTDEPLGLVDAAVGFSPAGRVPLLVGGNGERVLRLAGREADAVGMVGVTSGTTTVHTDLSHWSWDGLADRLAVARDAAAGRPALPAPDLLVQAVVVTDDRRAGAATMLDEGETDVDRHLDSPFVLVGTEAEIGAQLDRMEAMGVATVHVFERNAEAIAPVFAARR
jgi:probable F420-dependent oxidoreductase